MCHNSYRKLTIEFLSSLVVVDEEDVEDSVVLQFWLLNNDYSGNYDLNQNMKTATICRVISGIQACNVREMVTFGVHHPSISICLHLLADTFLSQSRGKQGVNSRHVHPCSSPLL